MTSKKRSQTPDLLAGSLTDTIDHGRAVDLPVPAEAEPMVSTSIRLPLALLGWAKDEASRQGLPSWSALVRLLLEAEQHPASEDAVVSVGQLQRLIARLAQRPPTA
jgi:hypothetical protein